MWPTSLTSHFCQVLDSNCLVEQPHRENAGNSCFSPPPKENKMLVILCSLSPFRRIQFLRSFFRTLLGQGGARGKSQFFSPPDKSSKNLGCFWAKSNSSVGKNKKMQTFQLELGPKETRGKRAGENLVRNVHKEVFFSFFFFCTTPLDCS